MMEHADIVAGFQTCPHVDIERTGRVAMGILARTARGEVKPVVSHRKLRMMTSSETHDDRVFPNNEVIALLHAAEEEPKVLSATLFATQPWLDVSGLGWSVVVVTDGEPELGSEIADSIGRRAWELRDDYIVEKVDIDEAIVRALAGTGTYALSEGSDSTTAGSLGDSNQLLRTLLARKVDLPCLLMVSDPAAVEACFNAGIAGTVTTMLGGALNPRFHTPVEVTGRVTNLTDGSFESHYGGRIPRNMGRTAVLKVGSISVMVTEGRPPMVDYRAYLSVGLDPRNMRIVQPKSAGAYREYYEPIVECIDIDARGSSDSNLTMLPYRRIDRPLWPWDAGLTEPW